MNIQNRSRAPPVDLLVAKRALAIFNGPRVSDRLTVRAGNQPATDAWGAKPDSFAGFEPREFLIRFCFSFFQCSSFLSCLLALAPGPGITGA